MIGIKAIIIGLLSSSLCIANISGIVTDTGSIPISGAVVQLEKGGQKAITGSDGYFTLVSTASFPKLDKLLPNCLSARIYGSVLNVTIAERVAIEVATFNINGKSLSNMRKTMDAGSHSIPLILHGAGIYLYRVKLGSREFLIKNISINRVPSGCSVTPNVLPLFLVMKQLNATIIFNDVITATKDGYLNFRIVAKNADTNGISIKMIASAGTMTDLNGNVYHAVKLGNQVWTVDNLLTTKYNDGSEIPLVTDSAAWRRMYDSNLTTPAFCYYNNTTNTDSIKKFGAFYNWYVVNPTNPKKIAPVGWHVPTDAEWDTLQNYLISKGYNWDGTTIHNKIGKSLATKTDWLSYNNTSNGTISYDLTKNNNSGFSALPAGHRSNGGSYGDQNGECQWWCASDYGGPRTYCRYLISVSSMLGRDSTYSKNFGFSIRLLRD